MKYDWNHPSIPTWVKWIVTNEDGTVCGFGNKPFLNECSLGWETVNNNHQPMKLFFLKPYSGDWKDSLEKKPV